MDVCKKNMIDSREINKLKVKHKATGGAVNLMVKCGFIEKVQHGRPAIYKVNLHKPEKVHAREMMLLHQHHCSNGSQSDDWESSFEQKGGHDLQELRNEIIGLKQQLEGRLKKRQQRRQWAKKVWRGVAGFFEQHAMFFAFMATIVVMFFMGLLFGRVL